MKNSKSFSLLLLALCIVVNCRATVHHVGDGELYESPNELYLANVVQQGDTIDIHAQEYVGVPTLAAWSPDDLLIRGVGGMPHLIANGQYIQGKGIWVLAGDNIIVENIEFSGASVPDQNGAGIRLDGTGMTVRHCYFHDNENGILTSNPYDGDILIEHSEFGYNGYGDGYSHNLYIGHVNKLTFRYNYSHHANIGHNLKSRAEENFIIYNRIMDEETGNSSRLADLPNGGFSIIMGNSLMQGDNAENNNLIGYGLEGPTNTSQDIYIINNTLVNKREASCLFIHLDEGTVSANISNNVFAWTGDIVEGPYDVIESNVNLQDIAFMGFVDEASYNYRLTALSPGIDQGSVLDPVDGISLVPSEQYLHPVDHEIRAITSLAIDIGAYEFDDAVSVHSQSIERISIYPNPCSDYLTVNSGSDPITKVNIYDYQGQLLMTDDGALDIDMTYLPAGIYLLRIELGDAGNVSRRVVKM